MLTANDLEDEAGLGDIEEETKVPNPALVEYVDATVEASSWQPRFHLSWMFNHCYAADVPSSRLNGCAFRTQEECEKFGKVKSVHIPRPSTSSEQEKPGVGFVFVAFDAIDSAAKAAASLRARTFDGRKVLVPSFCLHLHSI